MRYLKFLAAGIMVLALAACAAPASPSGRPVPGTTPGAQLVPGTGTLAAKAPTYAAQGQATVNAIAATRAATETGVAGTTPASSQTPAQAPTLATTAVAPAGTQTPMGVTTPASTSAPAGTLTPVVSGTSAAPIQGPVTDLDVFHHAKLGPILVNKNGWTLYALTQDTNNTSTCTGSCAQIWPPATATSQPSAGIGVNSSMVGLITRSDGTQQLTYNGHPLYYYSGDKIPGETNGQGIKGIWFTVSPSGEFNQGAGGAGTMAPTSGTPTPY